MGKVWWRRLHLDPVLAACFAALFAFPLAASIAASGQPLVAAARSGDAPGAAGAGGPLRDLPAFSAGSRLAHALTAQGLLGDEPRMRAALSAALSAALRDLAGPRRGRAVMRIVTGADTVDRVQDGAARAYPYRYSRLEPLLDGALAAPLSERSARLANDVAALLVLAAAGDSDESAFGGAAPVAFGLLDRARSRPGCTAQLNLAFLVSTNVTPKDAEVAAEFARAERRCPGDLTGPWMLGQFQSLRARSGEPRRVRAPLQTFRRLQRRVPRSPLGWSGEADTELRLAYQHHERRPFTARAHFRRALTLYRHAESLDRAPALAAGSARALAGLGEYAAAAREQRRAVAGRATLAPVAARHVEYLERAHAFGAAAQAAQRLAAAPRFASGRSLIVDGASTPFLGIHLGEVVDEETSGPLSIGVDRLRAVALDVSREVTVAGAITVQDLSFIPAFRALAGVTGHNRWCPAWSRPRDLLLSGDPHAARAALPARATDIRSGETCKEDLAPLAAMIDLEARDPAAALRRLRSAGFETSQELPVYRPLPAGAGGDWAALYEARQNMWRFAGRLGRARAAADAWLRRLPHDPSAADRRGEIAFLAKQYGVAARWFARAVRLTRATRRGWTAQEAFALLKRGAALRLAGRRAEAVATLDRADEVASRARTGEDEERAATFAAYHARVQAGDAELRGRRYAAAAEAYEAARELEPQLAEDDGAALARPEALHNDQAIAEAKLGHVGAAVKAARAAVAADPLSPIFLATEGYALRRAGRLRAAERAYAAAVRADPTGYANWNDLGVVRAAQGELDAAVQAFRRAVGVRGDYALGWFNLGVAQGRRGLGHALAAQGALGRAFGADGGLRDRERRFIADDAVYFTDLDLSKPLPPRWSFASTQQQAPISAAGLVLVLLLGLRLGRALLARSFGGDLVGRLMDPLMSMLGRLPRVPVYTPAAVAVLATVAVLAVHMRGGSGAATEVVVLVAGVIALIAVVLRGRALAARHAEVAIAQRGWTPGIALAAAAVAGGVAWAPLPVAEPSAPAASVHWIGPVLTGLAALGLLVLGSWLDIPGTLALASVALVMTASLLTPAKPLDGGYVATGTAGVAVGLALLGGGLFFVLGVG